MIDFQYPYLIPLETYSNILNRNSVDTSNATSPGKPRKGTVAYTHASGSRYVHTK